MFFPQANQDHVFITPESKAWFVNEIQGTLSGIASLPSAPILLGAYPNPSVSHTTIAFALSDPDAVRLDVFDAAGRHVRTLAHGVFGTGRQEVSWDGRNDQGLEVAAGVYLYQLDTAGTGGKGRMTLVR